jgi:hypothetical protein
MGIGIPLRMSKLSGFYEPLRPKNDFDADVNVNMHERDRRNITTHVSLYPSQIPHPQTHHRHHHRHYDRVVRMPWRYVVIAGC